MKFIRLETAEKTENPIFEKAMELYRQSFPLHEQRERTSQNEIMHLPDYHFNLIYEEEQEKTFVGMILCWETDTFIYIEHFCIDTGLRGRRYGQRALDLLRETGKKIILEIDPPADEISIRRLSFYEKAGYKVNPFPHIHPPYHAGNKGHALTVLSCPEVLTSAEYDVFNGYLKDTVMKGAAAPL